MDGATDALEDSKPEPQNPGSSLIVLCKIVYPFDQEKFSREISLPAHSYHLLFPKQFFFLWTISMYLVEKDK